MNVQNAYWPLYKQMYRKELLGVIGKLLLQQSLGVIDKLLSQQSLGVIGKLLPQQSLLML